MNLEAIVRIKTCCSVSENFVRNFVFLCICCNFRLRILGFLVSAGHAFVKIRPLLLSTFYKTRNETRWLMGNIYVSSKFTFISHYREHVEISQLSACEKKIQNIYTINDLVNTRGVYLILGVQARAFKRERHIITVTVSKKTNILSAKLSGEFKDSGISSSSIDTSRPSRDPYRSLKSQH